MDKKSFERALLFGFGSAIIHLSNCNNSTEYNDILFEYSVKDSAYDAQCEGTKAQYLWNAIRNVGNMEELQSRVINALKDDNPEIYRQQVFELGILFYKESNYNPISIMLENCRYDKEYGCFIGCDELAEVVGKNQILFLADLIAARFQEDEDYDGESFFIENLQKRFDDNYLKELFSDLLEHNKKFEKYFIKELNYTPQKYTYLRPTYEEIKAKLLEYNSVPSYHKMRPWARKAMESELQLVEHDINHSSDTELVRELLYTFSSVPYKGNIEKVLGFLDNPTLSESAVCALKWKPDKRIRKKAISIISSVQNWYDYIPLLLNNYQTGDYKLIFSMCNNDYDEDLWHTIQMRMNDLFDKHENTYFHELYALLYKHNRCTICRKKMVGYMLRDGFSDSVILNELKWDANIKTREIIKSLT